MPNDTELKVALARMLPELLHIFNNKMICWIKDGHIEAEVKNGEWLYIVELIEEKLRCTQWQERARALISLDLNL